MLKVFKVRLTYTMYLHLLLNETALGCTLYSHTFSTNVSVNLGVLVNKMRFERRF